MDNPNPQFYIHPTPFLSIIALVVSIFAIYQLIQSPHFAYLRSYIITGSAIPGVICLKGYPIVGSLPALCKGAGGLYSTLNKLAEIGGKDGIAYCWVGPSIVVSLYDDAMVRTLLSQSDEIVTRDNDRGLFAPLATFNRIVGPQIFAWSDEKAKKAKAPFHALFGNRRLLSEYFSLVVSVSYKHVNRLVLEAPYRRVGITRLTDDFSNDLWAQAAFGVQDAHLQDDGLAPLLEKIDLMTADYWHLFRHAVRSIFSKCSTPDPEEQKTGAAIANIVQSRVASVLEEEESEKSSKSLLRKFSIESGGAERGHLHEYAVGFAKLAVFAGSQSNKHFITWALYELNRHPEVADKLRTELEAVLTNGSSEELTYDTFENETPYLDAFLKEVARLYPSTDTVPRVIMKEFTMTTPTGKTVTLKPGAMVFCLFSHLHTSKDLWGPDALDFVPQRWLDRRIPKGAYMPTGFGPRSCPGYRLSMMGTKMYLALLIRNYDVSLDDFEPVPGWTAYRNVPDTTFCTVRGQGNAVAL